MEALINNIRRLKKYFKLAVTNTEVKKADLLSTNESLKRFAYLWRYSPEDVMTMLTVIEYEFALEGAYTENDIAVLKKTLGEVAKFFVGCEKEWVEHEAKQAAKLARQDN